MLKVTTYSTYQQSSVRYPVGRSFHEGFTAGLIGVSGHMSKRLVKFVFNLLPERSALAIRDCLRLSPDLKEANEQILGLQRFTMRQSFAHLAADPPGKEGLEDREFQFYSQHGEDGILLYIFSRIGATDHRFVEFGIGDGRECNTANLSLSLGWKGLLMDADRACITAAKDFYARMLGLNKENVVIISEHIIIDNINGILQKYGFSGECDLLSIDIDGNDYWIWEAITVVNPRVVLLEYNASFGRDRAISVPYDPQFDRTKKHPSNLYHGASLSALARLGRRKDYVLVGCESKGVNAFFVRKDVAEGSFEPVSLRDAYRVHAFRSQNSTLEEQFAVIQHMPFEEILD